MSDEPLFLWSDDFQIGHKDIDNEHRHLFSLMQELADATNLGEDNKYVVLYALNQLLDYTETHFSNEEKLMEDLSYEDFASHVEKHEKLVRQVEELLQAFRSGKPVLSKDVLLFLKDWLSNHILHDDLKLTKSIQEIRKG